jgi:hypothetical protein
VIVFCRFLLFFHHRLSSLAECPDISLPGFQNPKLTKGMLPCKGLDGPISEWLTGLLMNKMSFEDAVLGAWVLEILAKRQNDKKLIELAEKNREYFETLAGGLGFDLEALKNKTLHALKEQTGNVGK